MMKIAELRNYLLKPGTRDRFIAYFRDHFVDTQEAYGVSVPQQYTVKNEPDRFFWIRGFKDMQQRSGFLPAFYGGPVWKQFGPAANEMMLEWHNVYLAKPLTPNQAVFNSSEGILVIDYYAAVDHRAGALTDIFVKEYIPLLNKEGITNISLWASEMTDNDFPRLPVYQDENLLIIITNYKSEKEYESCLKHLNDSNKELFTRVDKHVINKNTLTLFPA